MATRGRVWNVMHAVASASGGCPCHSPTLATRFPNVLLPHSAECTASSSSGIGSPRRATAIPRDTDYAFEMAASSIRYGVGVTSEIGADLKNWKAAKVAVFTDPNVAQLAPFHTVIHSLKRANVPHIVYDRVSVEPTDSSIRDAIDFVRLHQPDSFVAVGGGSTIDTAKAANLYLTHPKNEFLDFVNAPIGKGLPVREKLKPLIAGV
ncbi:Hydroxyacid-oxoacid transhydrogenase, mitochondrial [Rhizoclosmatium hyalinum]|nr:Hydroxyacid-oxoacid transhydrogenase, mitochondrial [Rhizoclosmatium hyalinum]